MTYFIRTLNLEYYMKILVLVNYQIVKGGFDWVIFE